MATFHPFVTGDTPRIMLSVCGLYFSMTHPKILSLQQVSSILSVNSVTLHSFQGEGENEKGIDKATGRVLVEVSPDFYRPTDVVNLWGDPTKAKKELGWNPEKTSFEELVKIMVDSDMGKVAVERASEQVKTNLAEYLEKGIVK